MFSFLLGIYLGVELLSHMVILYLTFWGTCVCVVLIKQFWNNYRLRGSCQHSTERSSIPFIQFPPMVTSCITTAQYQTWKLTLVNLQTLFRFHHFYMPSCLCACVYVCVCVCVSMQFYDIYRFFPRGFQQRLETPFCFQSIPKVYLLSVYMYVCSLVFS